MKPEYQKAALEAQGVNAQPENLAAHAATLSAQLQDAARGFTRLAFEAEPARFLLEQRRSEP